MKLTCAFLILVTSLAQSRVARAQSEQFLLGKPLPDFAEGSVVKNLAGQPRSLSALHGKVVLVNFWQSSSAPCVAELPNLRQAYDKYHARGLEIIGVSLDSDQEKLAKVLAEQKVSWPQYFSGADARKIATRYDITKIPQNYLLDPEGKVIAVDARGDGIDEAVERELTSLDALLANPKFWSLSQEEFARLPETAGFHWNSNARDSAKMSEQSLSHTRAEPDPALPVLPGPHRLFL